MIKFSLRFNIKFSIITKCPIKNWQMSLRIMRNEILYTISNTRQWYHIGGLHAQIGEVSHAYLAALLLSCKYLHLSEGIKII